MAQGTPVRSAARRAAARIAALAPALAAPIPAKLARRKGSPAMPETGAVPESGSYRLSHSIPAHSTTLLELARLRSCSFRTCQLSSLQTGTKRLRFRGCARCRLHLRHAFLELPRQMRRDTELT